MADLFRDLLAESARVQVPWVKVTIGDYTFGIFDRRTKNQQKDKNGVFTQYNLRYPNYIKSLNVIKINGQVNQYTLSINYPVTPLDDPNFFEKVFSSVSASRKIIFSYGDAFLPSFVYKEEEAIITSVSQTFSLENATINYTVKAVSGAALAKTGTFSFINSAPIKPSDEIKRVFLNSRYGLQSLFTGMTKANLNKLIDGTDKVVSVESKMNISPLDYILYLTGCMVPADSSNSLLGTDLYIMTVHDDVVFDALYTSDALKDSLKGSVKGGSYFKVTRTSVKKEHSDAYELNIGFPSVSPIISFSIERNDNFSLFYDYNTKLSPELYSRRLNNNGQWEDVFSPMYTSGNNTFTTRAEDISWFTKMTQYPIAATIKVQGLVRPASLMQYVRLNVVFPGGGRHISSGLYIVTKQVDDISESGYFTTLSLTKIAD